VSLESLGLHHDLTLAYEKLLRCSIEPHLPGSAMYEEPELTPQETEALLAFASHSSLSDNHRVRNLALEIISRVAAISPHDASAVREIVAHLLARLGNFPALGVIERKFGASENVCLGIDLALENVSRRVENTVSLGSKQLRLTDFQAELIAALAASPAVSVSAPTSAGKSFAFLVEIVEKLLRGLGLQSVYVVPTRALIRQVAQAIRAMLRESGAPDVPVRCIPVPLNPDAGRNGVVYVLTQERLLSLLHSDIGSVSLDAVYIDESQGISVSAGARGIILQSVLDEVRYEFPHCAIRMAGPMIRNPGYLLSLFDTEQQGSIVLSQEPPVLQNLLRVAPSRDSHREARVELLREDGDPIEIGIRRLDKKLGVDSSSKAQFALSLPRRTGCTIAYANTPYLAEVLARKLAEKIPEREVEHTSDLRRFQEFLTTHVHPEYSLAACITRRVAFHHGSMPSVVREGVEELVQQGELDFICCTSTLLQGVNLPASEIIVANPRRGSKNPMRREDFLNLAGRAGRLTRELQGNVWCLDPDSWLGADGEAQGCLHGETLHEVRSALEEVLKDGGSMIGDLLGGDIAPSAEGLASAALAKVYSDYIMTNTSLATSSYATRENRDALRLLEAQLRRTAVVTLPRDILQRNSSVIPFRLEELYQSLRGKRDLREWYPVVPRDLDTYRQLRRVFRTLDRYLDHKSTKSHMYDTWLATQWIQNRPLRQIIDMRLNYERANDPRANPSTVIRGVIDDIENRIRYRAVKYFRAYCDVLWLVLRDRHATEEMPPGVRRFYLFLECGASSPKILNLIGLGLSRTTSLILHGHLPDSASIDPETCLADVRALDLSQLRLPWTVEHEITSLLR